MLHRLPDGTRILIRPIQPGDKARLEEGLANLSAETIRLRFLAAKPRFTRGELRYLTEVDGINHVALVAVLLDDPNRLIAIARAVRLQDRPDTAEMAIVVGDPWQGQGLGTLMARRLSQAARAVGVRRFAASILPENRAVARLIWHIARELEDDHLENGLREITVDLAETGQHTLAA
jgi:RimJ/RimL family protein N-acetyltransferase